MTQRLYDNGYIMDFMATVLSCEPAGDSWEVTLDGTAFFPGGGGQVADNGTAGR